MLWPMIALSNIAQGSAVLGMMYLQRDNANTLIANYNALNHENATSIFFLKWYFFKHEAL